MSNYTPITDFSVKDALSTGNPSKIILGSEVDAELAAIQTAVNSKQDAISTYSEETSFVDADALSFYDDSAGSHKKITVSNLKNTLDTFHADTSFRIVASSTNIVTGLSSASYNSMAGYGNATESYDLGSLCTDWVLTPGLATSQTWILGVWAVLSHATTFAAGTRLQMLITRFNSSNVSQSRLTIAEDNNPEGSTYSYLSGCVVHNISSATDYFTIETYANQGNYNIYNLYFWGWRIR